MISGAVNKFTYKLSKQYGVDNDLVLKYFYMMGKPGIHFIEWPTGSGKSLLISILAFLYPITASLRSYIFCRTYTQINEYLERLVRIAFSLDIYPKISVLVGKDLACPYGDIYNNEISYLFCKYLGNGIRCPDYRKMLNNKGAIRLEKIFSQTDKSRVEDIIEFFIDNGICPYYSLRRIGQESEIILSTYHYLLNGLLPRKDNIFKYFVFIDEGHNLVDHFIESNLIRFDKEALIRLSRVLEIDRTLLSENVFKNGIGVDSNLSKEYIILLLKKMKEKFIEHYVDSLIINDISLNSGSESDNPEKNTVVKLVNLDLDSIFHVVDEDEYIKIYLLPKFTFFRNFLNSSYSTIIASATLSPYKFFSRVLKSLGIKKKFRKYSEPYLYNSLSSAKINIYVSRYVTSRYVNRTPDSFYFISDFSIKITRKTGISTILFVPSLDIKEVMYSLIKESLLTGDLSDIGIFIDSNPSDIENFLNEEKPSILVMNQRGRYSEGINIFRTTNKAFNVVIYGLSIQPTDPLKDSLLSEFFGIKSNELFIYGYILPAMIYFVQSIGRIISRRAELNLYILEKRILKYLNSPVTPVWFRKLIKNSKISIVESI